MSVSRQTTSRPAAAAELEHRLGELARVVERLHEGAVADLDVEHDRLGAGGDLLRHDARRDQRDAVDGRGHVAKGVEPLVGRDEVRGLRRRSRCRRREPARRTRRARARRGSPGSTRACRASRPYGRARGRSSSRTGTPQAATIGPTAIDVLSPTPPVECLSTTLRPSAAREVDRLAARDHRLGERVASRRSRARGRRPPCRTPRAGSRAPRRARSRARARAARRRQLARRRASARSARPGGSLLLGHEDRSSAARRQALRRTAGRSARHGHERIDVTLNGPRVDERHGSGGVALLDVLEMAPQRSRRRCRE